MRNKLDHLKQYGIDAYSGQWEGPSLYLLASVYAKIQEIISGYLLQHNLSITKFNILMLIKHIGRQDGISQQEIRQRLLVSAPNASRIINDLHKAGYIERKPDTHDRRIHRLRIRPDGAALLDQVWPEYNAIMKKMGTLLSKKDEKTLTGVLNRFHKQLSSGKIKC